MLIIHVSRRKYNITSNRFNEPLLISSAPKNISGTEEFDDTSVNFDNKMTVKNITYTLRSVVCSNVEKI